MSDQLAHWQKIVPRVIALAGMRAEEINAGAADFLEDGDFYRYVALILSITPGEALHPALLEERERLIAELNSAADGPFEPQNIALLAGLRPFIMPASASETTVQLLAA